MQLQFDKDKETVCNFYVKGDDASQFIPTQHPLPPPCTKNKLEDTEHFKKLELYMDMANALNIEASALSKSYDRQKRINKYGGKYKILLEEATGLFMAAVEGQLYEGEIGQIVTAFINGRTPSGIKANMEGYLDSKTENLNRYVKELEKNK